MSELMNQFLGLVNRQGRLNLLPAISGAYDTLLDQHRGRIDVDITVAAPLGDQQLDGIRRSISAALQNERW